MKITRHTGPDIRHALRAVRDSLGADAVILATRRTANGVEITAAMDFDADNVQDSTVSATRPALESEMPTKALPLCPPHSRHQAATARTTDSLDHSRRRRFCSPPQNPRRPPPGGASGERELVCAPLSGDTQQLNFECRRGRLVRARRHRDTHWHLCDPDARMPPAM